MSSQLIRILSPNVALACAALLALTACERGPDNNAQTANEIAWARAALERNPRLELVASDPQSGVLTVRERSSGEVLAVKVNELAAAPVSHLEASVGAPAAAPSPARAAQPTLTPTAASGETADQSPDATTPAGESVAGAPAANEPARQSGNYTIERADGRIRVSGPGVSIVSSGGTAAGGGQRAAGQRTAEPIICEGRRMLHLDNRSIYVDGDAITARGGCELYITNSRIVASGTGVVVQDAVVHVSNSHIEGARGSFDATDRARLFVRSSTFQGVPRRTELAMVQDQGGNRWR